MTDQFLADLAKRPIEVLNRGYKVEARIAAKKERLQYWADLATTITINPENASSGGTAGYPKSKVELCALKIVEIRAELADEIAALIEINVENRIAIEALSSTPVYKTLLELRYVNHLRWEEIAVRLSYTYRWTQELHRRAIADLRRRAGKASAPTEKAR